MFTLQIQPDAPPKHSPAVRKAVGNWAALTLVSVLILLAVCLAVLAVFSRHIRRNQQLLARAKPKPKPATDAWREAGRRVHPGPDPTNPNSDDDTVDLDPPPDPMRS